MTTKRIELWECDNCGERAINGNGHGWTARGDERFHACAGLAPRLSPQRASTLAIDTTVTVPAAALVVGEARGTRYTCDVCERAGIVVTRYEPVDALWPSRR